jgi:Peptidase family M28
VGDAGGVRRGLVCLVVVAGLLAGCQAAERADGRAASGSAGATGPARPPTDAAATPTPPATQGSGSPAARGPGSPAAAPSPTGAVSERPARFARARAMRTVRWLAGRIGPREATTGAYRRAARGVARRLRGLGYDVTRQPLRAPAGVSWGVPVPAGRTWNVVAAPDGFRPARPHLLVGAHLDTVPQAPGAEDNASGVAVLLELARLAARERTRLPVLFVAFAAEEPRGDGDAMHHFGSRAYVARMSAGERRGLRAMVSLDRVGVGGVVPVCTGGLSPPRVRIALVRAARAVGAPADTCSDNQASDHWSFEKAGEPAARLGSTPYAAYHSAADRPRVVNPAQLGRVGRVAWEWLTR